MNAQLLENRSAAELRNVYCDTMLEMMQADSRIVQVEADLSVEPVAGQDRGGTDDVVVGVRRGDEEVGVGACHP